MATTRFTNGVTNVEKTTNTGMMGQLDPTKFHTFFDDFDRYNAADWAIYTTEAGTGAATEVLLNSDGGFLALTNDDADDDRDFLQSAAETFRFEAGKKLWFKSRFRISDATQSDMVMGLQFADGTPLDVSDGVFFIKNDGAATVNFLVEKNDVATTATAVATLVDNENIILGFYYNGSDEIQVFVNDVKVSTVATTNIPDDEDLTVSFGIQNGSAGAKAMYIDYVFVSKER